MMGLEFTGEVPFADVYVHSVIQAPDGRRMSKSLGTGIDPLDEIDAHGADAVRFGLLAMSSTQDVRYSSEKVRQGQALANKLFNAARYVLRQRRRLDRARGRGRRRSRTAGSSAACRRPRRSSTRTVAAFDFAKAALGLYDFVYGELCDWYLEFNKGREYDDDLLGDDAPRPARDAAARPPGHPVRDRGAVVARARRRGPAGRPAGHRARRRRCATPTPRRAWAPSSPRSPRCARGATTRGVKPGQVLPGAPGRPRRRRRRSWRGWRAWTSTGDGELTAAVPFAGGVAEIRAGRARRPRRGGAQARRRARAAAGRDRARRVQAGQRGLRGQGARARSSAPSARSSIACDGSSSSCDPRRGRALSARASSCSACASAWTGCAG